MKIERIEKVYRVKRTARYEDYRFECLTCHQEYAITNRWARLKHFFTCRLISALCGEIKNVTGT